MVSSGVIFLKCYGCELSSHSAICSRTWRPSSVRKWSGKSCRTANIRDKLPAIRTQPPLLAPSCVTSPWAAVPKSARENAGDVSSGIRASTRFAPGSSNVSTTPNTLASVRFIANIYVDARATPRTKGATASARNPADSAVSITSVPNFAPPPVHHVWMRVRGSVPTMNVQWPVDRCVGLATGHRFVAEIYLQICARLPCDEPCPKVLRCGHPCPSGGFLTFLVFEHPAELGVQSVVNLARSRNVLLAWGMMRGPPSSISSCSGRFPISTQPLTTSARS